MKITEETLLGKIVEEYPNSTTEILNLGLDFCCKGEESIAQQCLSLDLDVSQILAKIQDSTSFDSKDVWLPKEELTIPEVLEFIYQNYHLLHPKQISSIRLLLDKVVAVHGENHAELAEIQKLFIGLSDELVEHMEKEENLLFPYITLLVENLKKGIPRNTRFSVDKLINEIEEEHQDSGFVLEGIKEMTSNFTAPVDACGSYQALFAQLQEFDESVRQHIFIENQILHPRAIALENQF